MTKYSLPEDLYTYQKEDYKKQLNGSNWLNFSEMGVGKTPTTLAIIEEGGYKNPLILCPNSLRLEWQRQIEDWVGDGITAVSSPDCYFRLEPILYSYVRNQRYKIVNYETLRNKTHLEMLNQIPFDIIVMDEIHKLRNPDTKQVKSIWEFIKAHPEAKIVGLSGSPIMNYPNDLYVPLSIVKPEDWKPDKKSYKYFLYQYCFWTQGRYGGYVYGTRNMSELKEKTKDFIIRHTKKEVLPFLPEKYYRRVELEMPPDQRKLYDKMETELKIYLDSGEPLWSANFLSLLTRLRQMNLDPSIVGVKSGSAKTEFIKDTVDSIGDNKLVIFSCFERYIYWLSKIFSDIPHVTITGKIPSDDRSKRVYKFQNDESVKLCLGTIQTMGEGVTLTAASTCILADRWWNAPQNSQAEDRLHRIGQKSGVEIIIPICVKSIDYILDEVLQKKKEMSDTYYQEQEVTNTVLGELR